jgi:hypothetical protein
VVACQHAAVQQQQVLQARQQGTWGGRGGVGEEGGTRTRIGGTQRGACTSAAHERAFFQPEIDKRTQRHRTTYGEQQLEDHPAALSARREQPATRSDNVE